MGGLSIVSGGRVIGVCFGWAIETLFYLENLTVETNTQFFIELFVATDAGYMIVGFPLLMTGCGVNRTGDGNRFVLFFFCGLEICTVTFQIFFFFQTFF